MNDNQYIAHGADVICHAGKKGMKWGQGPYSKLKGYITSAKKAVAPDSARWKETLDKDTAETAAYKANADGAKRTLSEYRKQNNANVDSNGLAWYKTAQAAKKDGDHEVAAIQNSGKYKSANKRRINARAYYSNSTGGKIDAAINNAKKKTKKAYRIVKSKAGQIFGKPKIG